MSHRRGTCDATIPRSSSIAAEWNGRRIAPAQDIKYLWDAVRERFAIAAELRVVGEQVKVEQIRRMSRLVDLARHAVVEGEMVTPSVDRARSTLADLEDERGRRRGSLVATQDEIHRLQTESSRRAKESTGQARLLLAQRRQSRERQQGLARQLAELRREYTRGARRLVALDRKVSEAPLEEAAAITRQRFELSTALQALKRTIEELEPSVANARVEERDVARNLAELRSESRFAAERTRNKIHALMAMRAADEREVDACERRREQTLLQLGEELYRNRPAPLIPHLKRVAQIDETLRLLGRRHTDLVDRRDAADTARMFLGGLWLTAGILGLMLGLLLIAVACIN